MIHQTSQDKCLRREVLINGRTRLKENCSSLGREISEGRLRRCIEMKLNGPLEWNTNALILCQEFRRQTLIHFDSCRSLVYSVCWVPRFPHYVSAPKCPNCLYLHLHWRRLPRLRKVYFSQGLWRWRHPGWSVTHLPTIQFPRVVADRGPACHQGWSN